MLSGFEIFEIFVSDHLNASEKNLNESGVLRCQNLRFMMHISKLKEFK